MKILRDVFEIIGVVALTVAGGMIASLPTALIICRAIETKSWLLGLLAFVVFVLTASVGLYIKSNLEAE